MAIPRNYVFQDGGVFVSYHQKLGTLLDIINIVKTAQVGKSRIEPMAVYFTIEMLRLVESLHSVGIIHADLKPDNLLLQVNTEKSFEYFPNNSYFSLFLIFLKKLSQWRRCLEMFLCLFNSLTLVDPST